MVVAQNPAHNSVEHRNKLGTQRVCHKTLVTATASQILWHSAIDSIKDRSAQVIPYSDTET